MARGGSPIGRRHRGRVLALEVLYELELAPGHAAEAALAQRGEDREAAPETVAFARELIEGIDQHRAAIDDRIHHAAPAWPLDQMPRIDVSILRLAIFEILFDNRTPLKAAINEAVELAKEYGGENSPRFVNGVLGAIVGDSASSARPPA